MSLPSSFNNDGLLDPGVYPIRLSDLRSSWIVTGKGLRRRTWDSQWRTELVDKLAILVDELATAGYERIYVGGSFVELKDHPGDIDGFFEVPLLDIATGRVQAKLNELDPCHVWDWLTTAPDPQTGKHHIVMWHVYNVELFPDDGRANPNLPGPDGKPQTWAQWFQHTREGKPKGVLRVAP